MKFMTYKVNVFEWIMNDTSYDEITWVKAYNIWAILKRKKKENNETFLDEILKHLSGHPSPQVISLST